MADICSALILFECNSQNEIPIERAGHQIHSGRLKQIGVLKLLALIAAENCNSREEDLMITASFPRRPSSLGRRAAPAGVAAQAAGPGASA